MHQTSRLDFSSDRDHAQQADANNEATQDFQAGRHPCSIEHRETYASVANSHHEQVQGRHAGLFLDLSVGNIDCLRYIA